MKKLKASLPELVLVSVYAINLARKRAHCRAIGSLCFVMDQQFKLNHFNELKVMLLPGGIDSALVNYFLWKLEEAGLIQSVRGEFFITDKGILYIHNKLDPRLRYHASRLAQDNVDVVASKLYLKLIRGEKSESLRSD